MRRPAGPVDTRGRARPVRIRCVRLLLLAIPLFGCQANKRSAAASDSTSAPSPPCPVRSCREPEPGPRSAAIEQREEADLPTVRWMHTLMWLFLCRNTRSLFNRNTIRFCGTGKIASRMRSPGSPSCERSWCAMVMPTEFLRTSSNKMGTSPETKRCPSSSHTKHGRLFVRRLAA
jgi:hypothetical protein